MRRVGLYSALTALTLVVLGVIAVVYVLGNIHVKKVSTAGGDDVSIQTPGGQFYIRSHKDMDPAKLGIPIYPNAKRSKQGGGATFEWTSPDGKEDKAMAVAGGEYVTGDSTDEVLSWYKTHAPNWVIVTRAGEEGTRLELNEGGWKRIVAVRQKGDGTHIGVATIGEPASN
jgi:hypothetical protein